MFGPAPLEDILCIQKGRQTGRNNSSGQLMCYENRTPLRAVGNVSTAANVTPAVDPATRSKAAGSTPPAVTSRC